MGNFFIIKKIIGFFFLLKNCGIFEKNDNCSACAWDDDAVNDCICNSDAVL